MPVLSLKTKMTLAISLLIPVLLSMLTFSAQVYFVDQIKQQVYSQQFTMLTVLADQIDDKLGTIQTELVAAAGTLRSATINDPSRMRNFFDDRPDTLAMFDNGLFLFSAQGKLLSSNPVVPHMLAKNYSDHDYLKRTMASRRAQISEPFISTQIHRHPVIMFTAPIFDQKGEIAAVLGGSIDLTKNNFLSNLSSIKLGEKGYLGLFNSARVIIAHHDRERICKQDVLPGVNPMYDKAIAGFEGSGEIVNSHQVRMISSFKRLKTTGWILTCNFPLAEAYAPVYRTQHYLLIALLVAFMVSILMVWLSMRHLTGPLTSFTTQVRALTRKGDAIPKRIVIETGDEIGVLGEAFNLLLEELSDQKKELQKQLDFSQKVIDTTPIPVFYKDAQGLYLGCNKAFEDFTGFSRQHILGKTVFDIAPLDLAEHNHQADLDLSRNNGLLIYECAAVHSDGTKHDVIFFKTNFPAEDGSSGGIIGAMLDITQRKQAQRAHEKTAHHLQLILDAAGDGIYGVDMEGRMTFVNPAAAQMAGWEQAELLGKHQHSVMHHTKACGSPNPAEDCPIFAAFRDGKSHHGADELFWRKDGTSYTVDYASTPIRENGEVVGAVVIIKETTERKLAEEQLLKLSQAVMQSPVSIVITDLSGNIEFVNPKFTQINGYEAAEIIGQNPRLLKGGKTPPERYEKLWGTITSGRVWTGELHNRQKNGETYWEHATISPIRNSAGDISHYMAFTENMTERKSLEEQLRQAQKMEEIGQLTGGVAHDFNNILTVIMGFGDLLQHGLAPDDPRHEYMNQILSASDRATHLTESLLSFSSKQSMLLAQVELNELAREHTKFLIRIIGEDITLKTVSTSERLVVLAGSGQIEQVLMNLATNARDAMPGGGELCIKTTSVQIDKEFKQQHGFGQPGRYALVTISDTGAGMDAETLEKVFQPFFTTKGPGRGTGLGLSIVYGIVKQHGGYITIQSRPGLGTTFGIYLPLIAEQGKVAPEAPASVPKGGKETILVVEDDPSVRHLVDSVLKGLGYGVILAEGGAEAAKLFESTWRDIDLALVDVIMPRMNGQQVCEMLKQRSPELKVLYMSGYTAAMIQEKGISIEGSEIIMKPTQPIVLARKIRDMLDAECSQER